MKAAVLNAFGDAGQLGVQEVAEPSIQPHELLVEVKAFSINPVETLIRGGYAFTEAYENQDPAILGWDVSGKVVEVGQYVTHFQAGDEVFGMVKFPEPAGAYAKLVAAPKSHVTEKPTNVSHEQAAASTLAALTAWQSLVNVAQIQKGQKVLILNASGGVGHFAVQMARHFGAYVIGTSSGRNKDFVINLGADEHIDYEQETFEDRINDADVVLDGVGGEVSYRALQATKEGGTLITLLAIATDLPEKAKEQGKSSHIMMVQPSGADMNRIAQLLEARNIVPHIEKSYALDEIAQAHRHVEGRRTRGKVVVRP